MRKAVLMLVAALALVVLVGLIWSRRAPEVSGPQRSVATLPPPAHPTLTGNGSISGRVVGIAGPVAGIHVAATVESPESLSARPCPEPGALVDSLLDFNCQSGVLEALAVAHARGAGDVGHLAEATTDAHGRFTLPDVAANEVTIWASSDALAGVVLHVHSGTSDLDVPVSEGVVLRGHVLDDAKAPLPGVRVMAVFVPHSRLSFATSGPDGAFSLPRAPTGEYLLFATAPGFEAETRRPSPEAEIALTLTRLRELHVVVTDESRAVPEAEVRRMDMTSEGKGVATSGSDGVAVLSAVGGGWLDLLARKADRVGRARCNASAASAAPCRIALGPSVALAATCRDESGRALEGARVEAEAYRGGTWLAESGSDGVARFEGLVPDVYDVTASVEGRVSVNARVPEPAPGEPAAVELVLRRGNTLAGRVTDDSGRGLSSVVVSAFPVQGTDGGALSNGRCGKACARGRVHTGDGGTFEIGDLDTGSYAVVAAAEGYPSVTMGVVPPQRGLALTLRLGAVVKGRVVDENGHPVEGAWVRLERPESARAGVSSGGLFTETGALGLFEMKGVAEGSWLIEASTSVGIPTSDTGPFENQRKKSSLQVPAKSEVWVDLRFDATADVHGRVVDERGAPIPEAEVIAQERSLGAGAMADSEGVFTLRGLTPGSSYRIFAEKEGRMGADEAKEIKAPAEGVVLVLRRRGEVTGRIVDASGHPIRDARIGDDAFSSEDGRFSLPSYRDDVVVKRVSAPGFATLDLSVPYKAGQKTDLGEVIMEEGLSVRGVVRDASSGAPIGGVTVRKPYTREDGSLLCHAYESDGTVTDSRGRFLLQHVKTGAKQVCFAGEHHVPSFLDVTAGMGAVDVQLDLGSRVTGVLSDADGQGLADVSVDADEQGGLDLTRYATTDAEGRFALLGLEAGTYVVQPHVREANVGFAPVRLSVSGHEEHHLDFRAREAGTTLRIHPMGMGEDQGCEVFLMPGVVTDKPDDVGFWRGRATELPAAEGDPLVYRNLKPGAYTLWLRLVTQEHPDEAKAFYVQPVSVADTAEQVLDFDVRTAVPYRATGADHPSP